MAFKVLVVGAGAQGKVIATWLSRWPEAEEVRVADIDIDAEVQLVEFPRVLPWWQQLAKNRAGDQTAIMKRLEVLEQWLATGTLATPGVVWMPPITIE